MTVEQAKIIDLISLDESESVVLTITDHLEWSTDDHLFHLQEKVNAYLAFIESGELLDEYPKATGKQVRIEVVCKFRPDDRAIHFLSHFRKIVGSAGFGFACRTLNYGVKLLESSELEEHWSKIENI